MTLKEVLTYFKEHKNEANLSGMVRFGINIQKTYGLSIPELRALAKIIGTDHELALSLYKSGIHEGKVLASIIDDPLLVTEKQMESWVKGFNSWDVTDAATTNLFDLTPFAWKKAKEWTKRKPEYEKRAGFTIMAGLAVHDLVSPDEKFEEFYPYIIKESVDERNFVRKAVNWALRNIGKRSFKLNKSAIKVSEELLKLNSKSANWIAKDAIRELKGETAKRRIRASEKKIQ
ncbi:MAG: DNA alkylation repair protein [Candidatus Firestonebacteria bacterium RIFOXYA2_FULL_40_8]|nr:MAG: DNA alkylation repair protein [Candidatus Firestonebacteria bacterium RIFOXYA2_FULL_40_8]